ncbi:MAG: ABC transporter permease [Lachnospiraceae bacterium]|nr:ABC transporter permease [Lachnospiraceae bacterium]
METLVRIKDWLKAFYGKYDIVIVTLVKFLIAFVTLKLIGDRLGYIALFENPFVLIIISLVCSLLPYGLIATVLSVCLLANVYKASFEMAVIIGVFLIIVALLYYSFHPGDAVVFILTPVLFAFRIPYVIPLMVGLAGSIYSIIPVACGTVLYYLLAYIKGTPAVIATDSKISIMDLPDKFLSIIDEVVKNKEMWVMIAIFAAVIVIVYIIRKLPFRYSWFVAVGAGSILLIITAIILKSGESLIMILDSCVIACIYTVFKHDVDYKRTERLQFADDDYYYYVTAVPKISVDTFYKVGDSNRAADSSLKNKTGKKEKVRERQ